MTKASEIAEFIKIHDNFLIASHVFPDGDNLGSLLTVRECMEILGKRHACYVYNSLPKMYRWLPGSEHIDGDLTTALSRLDDPDRPTLFILDSGDFDRMGEEFSRWLDEHRGLISANVDHHVSNKNFATVNWIGRRYSSVGEMLVEVIDELGIEITQTIATNIFVSIYTDTGKFSFSNTSVKSFEYAGRMVAAGAKPIQAFRNIYTNRSFASFKLQNLSFQTLTNFLGGKGCHFRVDQRMLKETGTSLDDTDGFIDTIRTLEGYSIVVFFKEVADNDIRLSIRSMPPINASKLMAIFGGGGHPRAAGCRINLPVMDAIDKFVSVAEDAIRSGQAIDPDELK